MKVAVIIPVGPGHETLAARAVRSVRAAFFRDPGPFAELTVYPVLDSAGQLGRSAARNLGMDETPADFHFLLDADDEMTRRAFELVDLAAPATFGAVSLSGRPAYAYRHNRWPVTRETLFEHGPKGTLSMGCFVKGDLGLRFDETLDVGEDFDFYLRLPGFTKRREPLVTIGYNDPSAGGPRGYTDTDWLGECSKVIERYRV